MRVLLIEPPFHRFMGFYRHYFPLGLAYIASMLAKQNHTVKIYDVEHDPRAVPKTYLEATQNYAEYLDALEDHRHSVWKDIRREVSRFRPDIVGISSLTVKVPSALKIASLCRELSEDITIVVGGEHPTARPQDFLKNGTVDFVVRGEGEQTMCELVEGIGKGGSPRNIDGISFTVEGEIRNNKSRPLIENLDSLPMPGRDLLENRESYRPIDFGLIMGSRGCSYRCTFCPNLIWEHRARFRSTDGVIDEIKSVIETYSTKYFSFRDYSFASNRKWVIDFCQKAMKEKLEIQWECTTRPNLITDEIITYMKNAGCTMIRVGVESGSPRILNEINKGISLDGIRKMARILRRHGLYWAAYFMFGLPSETPEDIEKTLTLIDEIDPPFVSMARYTPLPGSEMYEDLVKENMIRENEVNWGEWGNQWLRKGFRKGMNMERFHTTMEEIAGRIDVHNRRNELNSRHPLFQPDSPPLV